MTPNENASGPENPEHQRHHHREGLERQKGRPMWGCVRGIFLWFSLLVLVLVLIVGGGWYYLGTTSFAELVRLRVETNLEAHLGRDVSIKKVTIVQSRPARVILDDVRIANLPGSQHPSFAIVRQVEITGGIESFWTRTIRIGRVDIRDPQIFFEVYPKGSPHEHNFPSWRRSPPSRYQITRVELNKLFLSGGHFEMDDLRQEIYADVSQLGAEVTATSAKQMYEGTVTSALTRIRIQDYHDIDVGLRGGFLYEAGALHLESVALRGKGIEAFVAGSIAPLTDAVYNLHITAKANLARVRQIFEVEAALGGNIALDAMLRGEKGTFALDGNFAAPAIHADAYDLSDLRGRARVTDTAAHLDITTGKFAGGTLSGRYDLAHYAEPYPMSVDLRYDRLSLEKLFDDWGMKNTGLRGAATGTLQYAWNKDKILDGSGEGKATLRPGTVAFGDARYPMPLSGNAAFKLDRGTIHFSPSTMKAPQSDVAFKGSLRIEDLFSNLDVDIVSRDFAELDELAYNMARSAGKNDFELLGFGGRGRIQAHVSGKIEAPDVTATIQSTDTRFNNELLGSGDIQLTYAGKPGVLTFQHARFQDGDAQMAMTGTISFPEKGPSPGFDLDIDATNFPVERALKITTLDLVAHGLGSGHLRVVGTPDEGFVVFSPLNIAASGGELHLNGRVDWAPGEGNVKYDLDIGAQSFPVGEVASFLDLGTLPVTGDLTGTLHLQGTRDDLSGAGSMVVRNGSVAGEPVDVASAELVFTSGMVRATNITVDAPAGNISGEAEYIFATEKFTYNVKGERLDLKNFKSFAGLADILGGNVTFISTGAGTTEQPEIVVEATLNEATLRGVRLPPDAPPPSFYLAVRNGQLIVRGSAFDFVSIEGTGTIAPDGALSGSVRATITDLGQFLRIAANAPDLPAEGKLELDLLLGGNTKSLETLQIAGTIPTLDLTVSGERITPIEPISFTLANGRIAINSLRLARDGSSFEVAGGVSVAGDRSVDLSIRGLIDMAFLALFVPGMRADGTIDVAAAVQGTLDNPRLQGTADINDGEFKVSGFPQLIDEVSGRLVFGGDRITVEGLRATVGGGTVNVGGTIVTKGVAVDRVNMRVVGSGVSLRYFDGVSMAGDFDLGLVGDMKAFRLNGNVQITNALYYKDFDLRRSIVTALLERHGLVPTVAASWQDNVGLELHLSAPGTLAIRNNLATVTASADLDVGGTLANPVVQGSVTLDEGGKARFQAIDYRITRGTITFQNPFRIDPYFDITAEARVQDYDLTVNVTGTLERITPTVTSDPPVSDLTLLSLLDRSALSEGQSKDPTMQSLQTAGTSLLFESLGGYVGAKVLPFVDTVRLDIQSETNEPVVSIEKRIRNNMRAIVTYNTRDNADVEYVEWQLTPDWLLQVMRDSEQKNNFLISAIDARFRRRYEGHWTMRSGSTPSTPVALPMPLPKEPGSQATATPAVDVKGEPVATVGFKVDAPYDTEGIRHLLALEPGRPLRIRDMQDTINRLFATGDFRDVRIDATATAGGADVTIILSLVYRIAKVSIEGAGDERKHVVRNMAVQQGDIVSLSAIDRSATSIQKELTRRGYLEATVDPETIYDRQANEAEVILHVTRGPLAHIAAITMEGNTAPFTPEELIAHMSWKAEGIFRAEQGPAQAERVRSKVARKGYHKAAITVVDETYDRATHTASLRFRANIGPKVRVVVEGVPEKSVRGVLTLRKDEAYSEDQIDRASTAMFERLQSEGYFRATVDVEESLIGNEWVVRYHVVPGQKYTLREVRFEGNTNVAANKLQEVVTIAPPTGFRGRLGRLFRRPVGVTQSQLTEQRDAVHSYYLLHGYEQTQVAEPIAQTNADGTVDVVIKINEGPQTLVAGIAIEGNTNVAADDLPDLQVTKGKPLNPLDISADRFALTSFYATHGYPEIQVSPMATFSADAKTVDVAYRIAEGPKVTVDEVIVRGNTYTDRDVVLKKAHLKKGEPFSYQAILSAQQELYRLAIFRRVDVLPQNANSTVATRDIVVQVREGQNLTISGSLGYSTDHGARSILAISHRNLFGTGRYLGVEARLATADHMLSLNYREPFPFGRDLPTQMTLFKGTESEPDALFDKLGTYIEASRVLGRNQRWSLRYDYRITTCIEGLKCDAATGDIPIPGIDRENQEIKISSISPSFAWDRRDDPLNPTRGSFSRESIQYAFPLLRAETNFLKLFTQASKYLPVSRATQFVFSARFGLIRPLAQSGPGTVVPISERFVAGGEMTHRAFALDELGIEGKTLTCIKDNVPVPCTTAGANVVALGGNGMFVANVEYRFPIFGAVTGALFTDMGNIWLDANDLSFDELRYGVGAGIRYLTPVGPLRFDFGYKIQREPWEDPFAMFLSLGFPF